MNDISTINVSNSIELLANLNSEVETSEEQANLAQIASATFIPTLSIASGGSKSVTIKRIAVPGDWVVGSASFGPTLDVIPVTYRYKAQLFNKSEKVAKSSMIRFRGSGDLTQDAKWMAYKDQEVTDCEIQSGPELLLFIPKANIFCIFFSKKTLASIGTELWKNGQGRLCQLKTIWHTGKSNSWYKFEYICTNRGVVGWPGQVNGVEGNIELDFTLLKGALELFTKVPDGPEEVANSDEQVAR